LLRAPRLLVLDEATSALDLGTEAEILSRLRDLPFRPTIVLVSHRLESLAWCDRVVAIEKGRIVGDVSGEQDVAAWLAARVQPNQDGLRRAEA
jgi:ABC-type bacteriocin/lantibiotic exporter with double-glycine peptidase domain